MTNTDPAPDTRPRCHGTLGRPGLMAFDADSRNVYCKGCPDCDPALHGVIPGPRETYEAYRRGEIDADEVDARVRTAGAPDTHSGEADDARREFWACLTNSPLDRRHMIAGTREEIRADWEEVARVLFARFERAIRAESAVALQEARERADVFMHESIRQWERSRAAEAEAASLRDLLAEHCFGCGEAESHDVHKGQTTLIKSTGNWGTEPIAPHPYLSCAQAATDFDHLRDDNERLRGAVSEWSAARAHANSDEMRRDNGNKWKAAEDRLTRATAQLERTVALVAPAASRPVPGDEPLANRIAREAAEDANAEKRARFDTHRPPAPTPVGPSPTCEETMTSTQGQGPLPWSVVCGNPLPCPMHTPPVVRTHEEK